MLLFYILYAFLYIRILLRYRQVDAAKLDLSHEMLECLNTIYICNIYFVSYNPLTNFVSHLES